MGRVYKWLFAAMLPVFAAATAVAAGGRDKPAEATAPAGNARSGHALYLRYGCYQCHGTSGQGAGQFGPKIAPEPLPYPLFVEQLRHPRAFMPIYTPKVLTDQEVQDTYAYLASIPPAKNYKDIPYLNRD